jgi:uncharacterized protein
MEDANFEVLHKVYDALAIGNFVGLMSLVSNDITLHVPGRSSVAGDYAGKAAVADYVTELAERSGGTLRFEPHAVVCTGEHGVGLVRDLAERDGRTLAMNNVHIWHVVDGTPTEIWIYPGDLYAWDDFWS